MTSAIPFILIFILYVHFSPQNKFAVKPKKKKERQSNDGKQTILHLNLQIFWSGNIFPMYKTNMP